MRPTYGHFRRRFWEINDVRRQMYVSPLDRVWWDFAVVYPLLRFALSHQIVRNTARTPGEIATFVRRPLRDWCLRSVIDWSQGYPRSK